MQLHQIPSTRKKGRRRGRGGKKGTTSGRGTKGQKSRAGHKKAPAMREFLQKFPKQRGYRFSEIAPAATVLNVGDLNTLEANTTVTPSLLVEKRLVRRVAGRRPVVKILGKGEVTKPFSLEQIQVSKTAAEKIKQAGGSVS